MEQLLVALPVFLNILDQAPAKMYKVKSFALFFADDGNGKKGLWRSDGTKDGTYFLSTLTDDASQSVDVVNAYSDSNLLYFLSANF